MRLLFFHAALLGLAATVALGGCDDAGDPDLLPIGPQRVSVHEELVVPLGIQNPGGDAVRFRFEAPALPGLDRVTSLSGTPSGGEFRWTPLASHVGLHELIFVLETRDGERIDSETALFEIAPAEDAAPVFLRPGPGGTFDLARTPCVELDVEVRDDDSAAVTIGLGEDAPEGATIQERGLKRAQVAWCPTADQVAASERWTLPLFADDAEHAPVELDYIVVLRGGSKENCPGEDPVITVQAPEEGARLVSSSGYDVRVQVSDDQGLRDAPLLYYSGDVPEDLDDPDITGFQQRIFAEDGDGWIARIPALGLEDGEERAIFIVVSATDNDDPAGSRCDHRVDSPVRSFIAVGGDGSADRARCQSCSSSAECETSLCVATASGGRCLAPCAEGDACDAGACVDVNTVSGATRRGCGGFAEVCDAQSACTDDAREEDDTVDNANPMPDGPIEGTLCPGDQDIFEITGAAGDSFEIELAFDADVGDLDLELYSEAGGILAVSASEASEERVSLCLREDLTRAYAFVYGFQQASAPYIFTVTPGAGACCEDDAFEPDDSLEDARSITWEAEVETPFEGTICSGDNDYIAFDLTEPARVQATIIFGGTADLDLELYGPDGSLVGFSRDVEDLEEIDVQVTGGGTYTLHVFGYAGESDTYLGGLTVTPSVSCESTLDCPSRSICSDGACEENVACGGDDGQCPAEHLCVPLGPAPAESLCGATCGFNTDCRSTEACKRFADSRRACGRRGSAANGDACETFEACGGQRACLGWTGGYCARHCETQADCESGTYCEDVDGQRVCALSCVASDDVCRLSEGYACELRETLSEGTRFICVPEGAP